jgi:hypothetical protein
MIREVTGDWTEQLEEETIWKRIIINDDLFGSFDGTCSESYVASNMIVHPFME